MEVSQEESTGNTHQEIHGSNTANILSNVQHQHILCSTAVQLKRNNVCVFNNNRSQLPKLS